MDLFAQLIPEGPTVIELGGHIGYVTQFFSKLVGGTGRVIVFEPGTNNLPYIRRNTEFLPNTCLVEAAVCDTDGMIQF
jgi:FkbM family methyltransferase